MGKANLLSRPPIVVVLGHVDHGKTTLLDAIRKTNVAAREAGGITQKIGASTVITKEDRKITFIDTPGHAAFSAMRSRGAKVADIAILVVSVDDGVQPQTREALRYIKEADIPFIVAITKVDNATPQTQVVLGQLEKEGVALEKRGGDTPWLEVSAKMNKGIAELLELISLLTDVNGLKGDPTGVLEAVVIETSKEKGGSFISVVVRNGTLHVGDTVYSSGNTTKVRGLIGEAGSLKEVHPGEPVQILGFETPPAMGDMISSEKSGVFEENKGVRATRSIKVGKDEIGVIIKASNAGALEAVLSNLPEKVVVVESSVGDIFESDVLLAKSNNASIFAFESKIATHIRKLAEAEGVKIFSYKVIYELFDELKDILKKGQVDVLGKAEVIASFPFNNKQIAGCKVVQGRIVKTDILKLVRKDRELGRIRALSLKKQKQEVNEVRQGEEFGMLFNPQLDFTMGDVILAVNK